MPSPDVTVSGHNHLRRVRVPMTAATATTTAPSPATTPTPKPTDATAAARVVGSVPSAGPTTTPAAVVKPGALPIPTGAHQGLPEAVVTLGSGMTVTHGTDPGDFYCEHAFFTSTQAAESTGSSILKDRYGAVLTAFLHNPSDAATGDTSVQIPQGERHAERREIIGCAIRGDYEACRPQIGDAPFRMLVTGYGPFVSVVNNPTGDFVSHVENMNAAVKHAFGDALVNGKVISQKNGVTELRYQIREGEKLRTVRITAALLPVSDEAINGGPRSLQALIRSEKPQAVLSLGVAAGSPTFLAEFHCDDGGLGIKDGHPAHDDGHGPTVNAPDNYSLARALFEGARLTQAGSALVASAPASTAADGSGV